VELRRALATWIVRCCRAEPCDGSEPVQCLNWTGPAPTPVCMCVCVYVCVIPHSKLACRMQVSKLGGREGCKSVGPPKLVTCNWRAALRQHGTSSHSQQAATFLIFDAQIRKHDPVENVGSCAWHCRTLWSTSMCLKP
jgi:hypothetical protein